MKMNERIDKNKLERIRDGKGFIAALDQSGGSTPKALANYGIKEDAYKNDDEMFELIHEIRKRVFTSPSFDKRILGAILFYKTMESKVNDVYTSEYLWNEKGIVSFLKVDKGLEEEVSGVQLMRDIDDLEEQLDLARKRGVFGTKMRSVIHEASKEGIDAIVTQQFNIAKKICDAGLVPIIEPEVDIHSEDKELCEEILKDKIKEKLEKWDKKDLIMFKLTLPTINNYYKDLYDYEAVVRVVALSGGYSIDQACDLLEKNNNVIASFSRALLEGLSANQTDEEFNTMLNNSIQKIYTSSIS